MRRLAERLGAHATSLYWHVATKDDVLDLALDAVFAELDLPDKHSASWQDDIEAFMTGLRSVLLRHPWAAALANSRPPWGPTPCAPRSSPTPRSPPAASTGCTCRPPRPPSPTT
ncbi:TetR/AcrR family transcriptional regulator C-terminal domain-containing protein [Streptomyces sp. 5-6(2022)]|uniref:TetR/AcrR family transcriptional regulator n=1 Tax=Streptomyces sp. 5-6(2022) TaxID=2936510 RepID=UPI0023B91122|nr:TetR/AcrR family transcriptional regulator C-terminal domain-containing protein [Streptomyces sp. 5-6(2022)]